MNQMSESAKQLRGMIINQILKTNPELQQRLMNNMNDNETLTYINSMCEAIIKTPAFVESLS